MNTGPGESITDLLAALRRGDKLAADALFASAYAQLRALAQQQLAGRDSTSTIVPTELVHEAYMKMCHGRLPELADRRHFFAISARAMRQVLVDRARRRDAQKRSSEYVTLRTDIPQPDDEDAVDVLALDKALNALAEVDARKARAMAFDDIARLLEISRATLARDYRAAEAWLYRAMQTSAETAR